MSLSTQNRVHRAKRRRGLTLIEAAMVLAILAIVVAGVMVYYQNANNNQKLTSATQQITAVQQAVQGLYAGQSSKTGLQASQIVDSLPASMVAGNDIRNPYNGTVAVAAATVGFTLAMNNVPKDACQRLAVMDMGRQTQAIAIGANKHSAPNLPVSPGDAQDECTDAPNTITWTFY